MKIKSKLLKIAIYLTLVFGGYISFINLLLGLLIIDVGVILLAYGVKE